MNYTIDKEIPLAPYRQIANQMIDDIKDGNYGYGQKLMSVRTLAKAMNISHVTADKVFKYLESEKLVERIQGRGAFVIYKSPFNSETLLDKEVIKQRYASLRDSENYRSLMVNLFQNTSHVCTYNFSYALLNPEFLNDLLPSVSDLSRDPNLFKATRVYGEIKGYLPLREIMISELQVDYSLDEIIITNGNQHGINLAVAALINKGDTVLIETPTFTGAVDILHNAQARLIPMKIFQEGFCIETIEELCIKYRPKLMYLTPNFSNPTGYCLDCEKRRALLAVAERNDFYILEDDHWSDFAFEEKLIPLALMPGGSKRVIYLKGFSKIIGADNRIGALLAPKHVVQRVERELTLQSLGVAILPQEYLYALIKKGYYKRALEKITSDLKRRVRQVDKYLKVLKVYGLDYEVPRGGLNYWIKLPDNMNSEDVLFNVMYENDITFLPGRLLDVNIESNSSHYLRLNYSFLSYNQLTLGLERLVNLLKAHF